MATLLATEKMPPELVRRIEARLGRPWRTADALQGGWTRSRWIAVARLLAVVLVSGTVALVVRAVRRSRAELNAARSELLDEQRRRTHGLVAADRDYLERIQGWLSKLAGPYEGDSVSLELRPPGALDALFARPIAYVHGPLGGFANSASIAATASTSFKDALLLCLVAPPASRAEKVVLARVLAAYRGGASVEQETPRVRLLQEAFAGWPFAVGPWTSRVLDAAGPAEVDRLGRDLRGAPVERAVQAAHADLLLAAMDEPGPPGGPTELDGERPHDVRLCVVELTTARTLLRVRRRVDPNWISTSRRSDYAAGLDQCALAFDVVQNVVATR
ncbi:MAG TPA: hypothetical protein VKU41_05105 [Polyangiaceae bacterium]|nr:hypothetical protein [Polyangiaceae bacterium]